MQRVRNVDAGVPVSSLGDSQFDNPATPTFGTEDQRAWNNLDKNWAYNPQLSSSEFRLDRHCVIVSANLYSISLGN